METIAGFSKLTKDQKMNWIASQIDAESAKAIEGLKRFWSKDPKEQKKFDEFSENTISNFYLPYGVAPNFMINGKIYCIPLAIEESSVVAAASKAANFWLSRGGFHAKVISTTKVGQVHFLWHSKKKELQNLFKENKKEIMRAIAPFCQKMNERGGGVIELKLVDKSDSLENYFQIEASFETCDAMGANFINTILEEIAKYMRSNWAREKLEIIMSILSNYTPDCLVEAWVECPVEELDEMSNGMNAVDFARRFKLAVDIARVDKFRAVTHNKGIFNGIDAVVLATGNDFRATEACGHAYAAEKGYKGLTIVQNKNNVFRFSLKIPLALGTVGGLTNLHPVAKASLKLLGSPDARELMQIAACVGLAQNFAAIRSLVTTGIQKGHMKMHLLNILNQLEASRSEIESSKRYFSDKTISFTAVRNFLNSIRMSQ